MACECAADEDLGTAPTARKAEMARRTYDAHVIVDMIGPGFSWLSREVVERTGGYYTTGRNSSTGNQQSLVASVAMQYAISPTLAANMRYSYLDRLSSTPGQTFYQNLFLVGLSKQF